MGREQMEKFKMKFNIAGVPKEIELEDINIDKIDLDPENPRIGYWTDNQVKETFSQDEIAFALREHSDDIRRLRLSIEANEGAIEPIWVCRINNRFLVIDGNTRIEIYKDLSKKYPQKEVYKKIKCRILSKGTNDRIKNFIRLIAHLRGINDWEVYERARMLYILWEMKGYTEEELQSTTKLSINQIKKWIEAYKNMTEQFLPEYGEQSDALSKFSYFVEYENPKIKQGMQEQGLTIRDFCKWVGKGEIKRAQDVRNLRQIFDHKRVRKVLAEKGYEYAFEQLSIVRPRFESKLFEYIEEVIEELKNMTRLEEEEIIEDEKAQHKRILLRNLCSELEKIIKRFK